MIALDKIYSNPILLKVDLIALVLFPIAAAIGVYFFPVAVGPVSLYFFRVLTIAYLFILILVRAKAELTLLSQTYTLLIVVWLVWAGMSGFWTPDTLAGFKDFIALGLGIISSYTIIMFATREYYLYYLRIGWIWAFFLTSMVAVWEIVTGEHLVSYYTQYSADYKLNRLFVSSTFGNPNNYGAFLVLCFPFMLWEFLSSTSKKTKIVLMIFLLFFPVLLVLTGSRLCFVGWFIELFLIVVFLLKGFKKVIFIAFVLSLTAYVISSGVVDDLQMVEKMTKAASGEGAQQGSILVRINTSLNGLWMVVETYGIGVGVGGFEHTILHNNVPYITYGISNPHNFLIAVVAEFGIFVFTLFVLVLLIALYKAIVFIYSGQQKLIERGIVALLGISGYAFASTANSTYLEQPVNWIFLGSMISVLSAREWD